MKYWNSAVIPLQHNGKGGKQCGDSGNQTNLEEIQIAEFQAVAVQDGAPHDAGQSAYGVMNAPTFEPIIVA